MKNSNYLIAVAIGFISTVVMLQVLQSNYPYSCKPRTLETDLKITLGEAFDSLPEYSQSLAAYNCAVTGTHQVKNTSSGKQADTFLPGAQWEQKDSDRKPFVVPDGFYGREKLKVESIAVNGKFSGVAGQIHVNKTYTNTNKWPRAGALVEEDIVLPPGAAIHSFWITERGKKIPAVVRAASTAERDFRATVRKTRDPGLIQWKEDGTYKFSLYPVLNDGTLKIADYQIAAAYEIDKDGWVDVAIPVGKLPVEELKVQLSIETPFPIEEFCLPKWIESRKIDDHNYTISGTLRKIRPSTGNVTIAWKYPSSTVYRPWKTKEVASSGNLVKYETEESSFYLLSLSDLPSLEERHSKTILFDTKAPESQVGTLKIYNEAKNQSYDIGIKAKVVPYTFTVPLRLKRLLIDGMNVEKLRCAMTIQSMDRSLDVVYDTPQGNSDHEAQEIAKLSLKKPDGLTSGCTVRQTRAHRRMTQWTISKMMMREPGSLRRRDSSGMAGPVHTTAISISTNQSVASDLSKSWLMNGAIPTFQKSRRRANKRACWANTRTLTGALEMFCLDYNVSMDQIFNLHNAFNAEELLEKERASYAFYVEGPESSLLLNDKDLESGCMYSTALCRLKRPSVATAAKLDELPPFDIKALNCSGKLVYSLGTRKDRFRWYLRGTFSHRLHAPTTTVILSSQGKTILCPYHGKPHYAGEKTPEFKVREKMIEYSFAIQVLLAFFFSFVSLYWRTNTFGTWILFGAIIFIFIIVPILPLVLGTVAGIYHAFDKMKLSWQTAVQTCIFSLVSLTTCVNIAKVSTEATTLTVTFLTTVFFFASWMKDYSQSKI